MRTLSIISFIFLFFIVGCTEKESATDKCWRMTFREGKVFFEGLEINGDPLPYYSIYIDEDNYSEITDFSIWLYEDGTWNSKLYYRERVDGVSKSDVVERNGTYYCTSDESSSHVYMDQTNGSEFGYFEWTDDSLVWILYSSGGGNEYLFTTG